jgi:hypothetical protein
MPRIGRLASGRPFRTRAPSSTAGTGRGKALIALALEGESGSGTRKR